MARGAGFWRNDCLCAVNAAAGQWMPGRCEVLFVFAVLQRRDAVRPLRGRLFYTNRQEHSLCRAGSKCQYQRRRGSHESD